MPSPTVPKMFRMASQNGHEFDQARETLMARALEYRERGEGLIRKAARLEELIASIDEIKSEIEDPAPRQFARMRNKLEQSKGGRPPNTALENAMLKFASEADGLFSNKELWERTEANFGRSFIRESFYATLKKLVEDGRIVEKVKAIGRRPGQYERGAILKALS